MTVTAPTRDRAVDVARLAALSVVMFGHCALLLASIDGRGLHVGNLIGALPAIAPVTWIVQVMPLFFLAGGAAGTYGHRDGTPWGTWLFTRAQRLCRPVFFYLAVWSAGLLVVRLTLGAESAARLGRESVALLWFLGVYLVTLAAVPALVRMTAQRTVTVVLIGLLAATALGDAARFALDTPDAGVTNFVVVWLIPVAIGVGYARRLISARWAAWVGVGAFVAQLAIAAVGPYDVSLVVTGAEQVSNVAPPTLLLAVHCTWMSCAFVLAAGALQRWALGPRVWRVVSTGNGGAMTLYLWHIPAIAVAAFALHAVGLDAYDVHAPGFWGLLAVRAVVFAGVMAAFFVALSPLEHRPLPWWDRPVSARGARATVTGALVCAAGVALVFTAKLGLTGGGWAALAVFAAALAAARIGAGVAAAVGPDVSARTAPTPSGSRRP
ncbi:acyltransferase family protein [Mycobacterium sp. C3-094]